ncbi:hypothetical protein GOBAR_AA36238 [Gossypium barbadense]|uniref:Uncharacterized protein n=1 Tax=Gossypium barbadense TaxID=3634 RepID=A0A2P5W050_GOSBA|nr:hypothetical protein GOBAR_AA36238 [Gossypium barbadense]
MVRYYNGENSMHSRYWVWCKQVLHTKDNRRVDSNLPSSVLSAEGARGKGWGDNIPERERNLSSYIMMEEKLMGIIQNIQTNISKLSAKLEVVEEKADHLLESGLDRTDDKNNGVRKSDEAWKKVEGSNVVGKRKVTSTPMSQKLSCNESPH